MRSEFHLVGLENSQTPSTSKVCPSVHQEDDRSCASPLHSLVQICPKAFNSDLQGGGVYTTRRPNLLRGDKVPILVPSDC